MKKIITFFLIVLLLPINVFANLSENNSENISTAITKTEYTYKINENKSTKVVVLVCDLNNPYFKIDLMTGKGKYTQRASVSDMADSTNALAATNGDFFNMALQGVPEGPSMEDGVLYSSQSIITEVYCLGIDENNKGEILQIKSSGSVTAPNGQTFPIAGLNRSYYWYDTTKEYSHESKIQAYNDMWAAKSRGDKKNSEILVGADGTIEQISVDKNFPFAVPQGKTILQVSKKAKEFFDKNTKIGDKIQIENNISPNKNWKFLIGGHALLVNDNKPVKYTKDINVLGGRRARTAAGVSKDGSKLFLLSAEGRTSRSAGLTLNDMSKIFVELGCYRAFNLDGGGSTAMVVKKLGDTQRTRIINPEKNNAERKVVNGIGLHTTAPATGILAGFKIAGPDTLYIGQSAKYSIKSAWDTNLIPMDIKNIGYSVYDMSGQETNWNGEYFLATIPGPIDIAITSADGISGLKTVNIKDLSDLKDLQVIPSMEIVGNNSQVDLQFKGIDNNNKSFDLNPQIFTISSDDGVISDFGNGKILINEMINPYITLNIQNGNRKFQTILLSKDASTIKMKINDQNYFVNNIPGKMDANPFVKNSRTLVPIRFIVEALKGDVNWNSENKTVEVKIADKNILIPINSESVSVNGQNEKIDSPALIKENRTYVPIRFISETIGMKVLYNDKNREITIVDTSKSVNKNTVPNSENKANINSNNKQNKNVQQNNKNNNNNNSKDLTNN